VRQKNKPPFPCGWGVGKGSLTIEIERMKADWVLTNVVKELNLAEGSNVLKC
jgi:hypothetical protein